MLWTRARCRRARWLLLATTGTCVAALLASHAGNIGLAVNRAGIQLSGGSMTLITATHPMTRSRADWAFSVNGQEGRIRHDGGSRWLPGRAGPAMLIGSPPVIVRTRLWSLPLWSLTLLSLAVSVPAWWALTKRSTHGGCDRCGYDTTGLAIDAPCPECGA
ncbi:MAG TPA: hypothetical protein VD997_12275 [Phycisphaerales bacterium]|nr:hypothetical protein [Phycisphaerales bacterium]